MRKLRAFTLVLATLVGLGVTGMGDASAATTPSSFMTCPSGQYARPGTPGAGTVSGGLFHYLACSTSSGRNYATIRVAYDRTASGSVNADFEWYWVNSSNQQVGSVYHDQGSFTASSGNWYGFTWSYSPPLTNGGYCILMLVRVGPSVWYLSPRTC
jgi:hypothetical protein